MKVIVLHSDFKTDFKILPAVEEWRESDAGHSTRLTNTRLHSVHLRYDWSENLVRALLEKRLMN